MGNGPTEEDAEIIQHDQLSTHSEDAEEVRASGVGFLSYLGQLQSCFLRGLSIISLKNKTTNDWSLSGLRRVPKLAP